MKKKLVSLLLAASLVATALTGCGKTEEPEKGTEVTKTEVTAEAVPEAKYYFSFDESAGTEGISSAAQGTGTVDLVEKPVKFMPGVKGDAVYTDGTTGYKLTNVNGVGDTYTVAFWIYATRYANYMPTVQFGPDVHGDATGSQHYVNITRAEWNQDGASFPCIWAYDQADNAKWPNYSTSGGNEHLKEWMHIALVVDANNKSADGEYIVGELYINGERHIEKDSDGNEVNPLIVFNTMAQSDNFDFLLGVNYWDKVFKGAFDELYIFDKALTAGQVATLYADGDANAAYVEPAREINPAKDEKAIESIGNLQFTSNYGDSYSSPVALGDGKTMQVKMKHWSDGKDSANNYRLVFTAGDKEVAVVNADMTGYYDGDTSKKMDDSCFNWTWANWNTWEQSVMVEDAVTLTVSREGNTITVEASNVDYVETANVGTVVFEVTTEDPISFTITNQKSYTDILSVKDATPKTGGNTIGSLDAGFWTTFSSIWEVPVNGSKTISFTNYTAGDNNWENFVAILQSTPEGHSADTEGYTEYGVVRADNWGWGAGYDGIATAECDWDFETFKEDIDGAHIVLTAYNYGDTADVVFTATTVAGKVYTQSYKGIAVTGPVYLTLTLEKSVLIFDGVTVGSNDCVQPFWSTFSDIYEVKEGETKEVSFTNYTDGVNNWDNFVVILQNVPGGHSADAYEGYKEYAVLRADNYGWGDGYASTVAECDWDFETFKEDMDGAKVVLRVTNNGSTADTEIIATTTAGKVYHQSYKGTPIDGPLYMTMTLENAYIVIDTVSFGSSDCVQPFWSAFSPIYAVPAGESKSISFTNFTDGVNNWDNFVVILQTTPTGHSADTEGYAEYAVLRADNYGWGDGYASTTAECNWDFDTFTEDMNGAHVVLTVTNNGSTADTVAVVTTQSGTVYTQSYTGTPISGDLYVTMTLENANVAIN